jgi:hypothetical protein
MWIVIKFSIWLLLGGVIALIPRFGEHSRMIWIFTFFLAFAAALSAYFKVS